MINQTEIERLLANAPGAWSQEVRRIGEHPLVPGRIPIYGYIFDCKSGRLIEVPEAGKAGARRPETAAG